MPDTANWWLFNVVYGGVVVVVWFCILDALYVGASVFKGEYKRIWPIKILRLLVSMVAVLRACDQVTRVVGYVVSDGWLHSDS